MCVCVCVCAGGLTGRGGGGGGERGGGAGGGASKEDGQGWGTRVGEGPRSPAQRGVRGGISRCAQRKAGRPNPGPAGILEVMEATGETPPRGTVYQVTGTTRAERGWRWPCWASGRSGGGLGCGRNGGGASRYRSDCSDYLYRHTYARQVDAAIETAGAARGSAAAVDPGCMTPG